MDADEVTTQVVLAAEGPTTRTMWADVRLEPVGVVGSHVCFEIVGPSERSGTGSALVLLARVSFLL